MTSPRLYLAARDARQVGRQAPAGVGQIQLLAVTLQTPYATSFFGQCKFDLAPDRQVAIDEGTGDHRPEACHGEAPVYRQAWTP